LSKTLRWHMPIIGEVPMSKYPIDFQSSPAVHFYLFVFLITDLQLKLMHKYKGSKSLPVFQPNFTNIFSFNPFIVYFIPECGEEYGKLKKLIE
jgi:hypothetical protein